MIYNAPSTCSKLHFNFVNNYCMHTPTTTAVEKSKQINTNQSILQEACRGPETARPTKTPTTAKAKNPEIPTAILKYQGFLVQHGQQIEVLERRLPRILYLSDCPRDIGDR